MTFNNYFNWKQEAVTHPILSVVIPAYNESKRILPTIGAIASFICKTGMAWELIVSDDGSNDGTPDMIEALGLVNVKLLRAKQNQGKGKAIQRGLLAARGKYILFTDADNSTPIEELGKLLPLVQGNEVDIAIGSRSENRAEDENRPWIRRLLSGGLRKLVYYGLQMGIRDTQCGFKLYRREVAHHICRLQTVFGFSFDLEHLYLARKYQYKIAEVPVHWIDAPGSKVNATKEVARFIKDLSLIRWQDWQGGYRHHETATYSTYNHVSA